MHYMNDSDIDQARRVFESAPQQFQVALGAALTLDAFRTWVDENSDGWAHWAAPVKSADRLMTLIEEAVEGYRRGRTEYDADAGTYSYRDIDAAALKRAYTPIRAFVTRYNNGAFGGYGKSNPFNFNDIVTTIEIVEA